MTAPIDFRTLSPARQSALLDAARRRAVAARHEAMQAFWSGLGRSLRRRGRWLLNAFRPSPDRAPGAC